MFSRQFETFIDRLQLDISKGSKILRVITGKYFKMQRANEAKDITVDPSYTLILEFVSRLKTFFSRGNHNGIYLVIM